MTKSLYHLVKQSKQDQQAMEELLGLFEPKLKKSLRLTHYDQREDLSQELMFIFVKYVQKYNLDCIPGFWELKDQIENKAIG